MLWRFSEYDSVREVAQNRDVLKLVLAWLQPLFDYNRVVREYSDPRIHSAHRRLWEKKESQTTDRDIHPGRWLVHITYPQLSACRTTARSKRMRLLGAWSMLKCVSKPKHAASAQKTSNFEFRVF